MRHTRPARLRLVVAAALLVTATTAGTALAAGDPKAGDTTSAEVLSPATTSADGERPREAAALTGTAKLERSAGDDITFAFDAHLAAEHNADPQQATGTFRFSHYLDGEGAYAEVEVDCLVTGGRVAVVSGTITDSDLPGAEGLRVGVSVHDNGRHDRLGYSWAATGTPVADKHLAPCLSSAPFEKVRKGTGDFQVLPWQPDL